MLSGETPIANNFTENLIETEEFQIVQNNCIFFILIGRTNNTVKVKSSNYSADLNCEEFSIVSGQKFKSINELFNFIVNIFRNKNFQINLDNNKMNIVLSFYNNNTKQNNQCKIDMMYSNNNIDYFINDLWNKLTKLEVENTTIKMNYQNLIQNYQNLSQELNQIKSEIQLLKNNSNDINIPNNNIINNNNIDNNFIQNFNNMNLSMNQQMNERNNNTISILFKEEGHPQKVKTIHDCNINDTISQLMDKYRKRINNPNLKFYLIYNTKILTANMTLKEAGLSDCATVSVRKGEPPFH